MTAEEFADGCQCRFCRVWFYVLLRGIEAAAALIVLALMLRWLTR